jgi:uncharacterized protein (TIGR02145 family)
MKTTLFLLLLAIFAFNCKKDDPQPAQANNIIIKTAPTKVDYFNGDALDLAGLVVTLEFDNGSSKDVAFSDFEAKGITTSIANGTVLTAPVSVNITHTESNKATSQLIGVTDIKVTNISVKTPPSNVSYIVGEVLDLSGLIVVLSRNNNTSEEVPLSAFANKGINCSPLNGTKLTASNTSIMISHTASSKNTNQSISIMSEITDIENNKYPIVKIGNQVWMAANLMVTKYRNGDAIGTTNPADKDIQSETSPKYQWAYDGTESNVAVYGRLYTWYAAADSRNVCPVGWHVPTDEEFSTLTTFLGGEDIAANKLKEVGTLHWVINLPDVTNETGFTALPNGYRISSNGKFYYLNAMSAFWTSTEYDTSYARLRNMLTNSGSLYRGYTLKNTAYAIRCLKD